MSEWQKALDRFQSAYQQFGDFDTVDSIYVDRLPDSNSLGEKEFFQQVTERGNAWRRVVSPWIEKHGMACLHAFAQLDNGESLTFYVPVIDTAESFHPLEADPLAAKRRNIDRVGEWGIVKPSLDGRSQVLIEWVPTESLRAFMEGERLASMLMKPQHFKRAGLRPPLDGVPCGGYWLGFVVQTLRGTRWVVSEEGIDCISQPIRASIAAIKRLIDQDAIGKPAQAATGGAVGGGNNPADRSAMSVDARAVAMLIQHPDWTKLEIAKAIGCHPKTLSKPGKFKDAWDMQKGDRSNLPRGSKSAESGQMEAWDEDERE